MPQSTDRLRGACRALALLLLPREGLGWRSSRAFERVPGIVGSRVDQELVHQEDQLASDRHDGALLRVLAAACLDLLAVALEVAVGALLAQHALRSLDHVTAHEGVARTCDRELQVRPARLEDARGEPEEGTHVPAALEACGVAERQQR